MKDYISIEYAKGSKLFVPVEQLDRIGKLSGKYGARVKLNKLGGPEWEKVRTRVKGHVEDIAKELIESTHSVIYFSAFRLFELFADSTFGRTDSASQQELEQHIFECDLLIIDDLGTELVNSFVSSQLFLVLNERILRRKSTLISTNLSLGTFADTYSERIFSRISSTYTMLRLIGDDIRIQKKLSAGRG